VLDFECIGTPFYGLFSFSFYKKLFRIKLHGVKDAITIIKKEINMDIIRKAVLSFLLVTSLNCYAAEAIDINVADEATLMSVKGIGEKRAAAIVAYRDKNGSFRSVDELIEVQGISESLVEKSRDSLKVSSSR
jgi:competence protein ComEA